MVADIVKNVDGDKGEVANIIGAGVDPHVYDPTRSDVALLLKSDIVFYAGLRGGKSDHGEQEQFEDRLSFVASDRMPERLKSNM